MTVKSSLTNTYCSQDWGTEETEELRIRPRGIARGEKTQQLFLCDGKMRGTVGTGWCVCEYQAMPGRGMAHFSYLLKLLSVKETWKSLSQSSVSLLEHSLRDERKIKIMTLNLKNSSEVKQESSVERDSRLNGMYTTISSGNRYIQITEVYTSDFSVKKK